MSITNMKHQLLVAAQALRRAEIAAAAADGPVVPGEAVQQEILALLDQVLRLAAPA